MPGNKPSREAAMISSAHARIAFLILSAAGCLALFGCSSLYRSGQTLQRGQYSIGGSYARVSDAAGSSDDAIGSIGIDARFGVGSGIDLGVAHSWTSSSGGDGTLPTAWFDGRAQLTNRENAVGKPIITVGLAKGIVYSENLEDPLHVTSLPVWMSVPWSDRGIATLGYKFQVGSPQFVPGERTSDPLHTISAGAEYALSASKTTWAPKLGAAFGYMFGSEGGSGALLIGVGLSFDSPRPE